MAKKLYVGGLPYSTTQDGLRDAFSQAGTVESATIITDKMTGRSKGFGLWNGKDFEGRKLTVNEARPMGDRPPRRDGGFNRGGSGGGRGGFGGGGRRSDW
jgi:cold-inducible RNA-binding protein